MLWCWLAGGCRYVESLAPPTSGDPLLDPQSLQYEAAEFSEATLTRRMKEIDDAYSEPRTLAKVNLSLETSHLSISPRNRYAALPRGARAANWLARNALTDGDRRKYAILGIQWGRAAIARADTDPASYYYLARNLHTLLELKSYESERLAREARGHYLMAQSLDPQIDDCGPAREVGRMLTKTRRYPRYALNKSYRGPSGISLLERAVENCPQSGENHLALAEYLIEVEEFERAHAVIAQVMDLPRPKGYTVEHQGWLARASDLLNKMPGL